MGLHFIAFSPDFQEGPHPVVLPAAVANMSLRSTGTGWIKIGIISHFLGDKYLKEVAWLNGSIVEWLKVAL